jgi:hypothetical protein
MSRSALSLYHKQVAIVAMLPNRGLPGPIWVRSRLLG